MNRKKEVLSKSLKDDANLYSPNGMRAFRLKYDITQFQLAKDLGVSQQLISKYELGYVNENNSALKSRFTDYLYNINYVTKAKNVNQPLRHNIHYDDIINIAKIINPNVKFNYQDIAFVITNKKEVLENKVKKMFKINDPTPESVRQVLAKNKLSVKAFSKIINVSTTYVNIYLSKRFEPVLPIVNFVSSNKTN